MNTLLYFLIWAGFIFFMMRFGCGAHISGHGQSGGQGEGNRTRDGESSPRWIPPAKDIDPVCHKTVATDSAKPTVYAGYVYYFCSRECRERFEAAPQLYTDGTKSDLAKLEHSHA